MEGLDGFGEVGLREGEGADVSRRRWGRERGWNKVGGG